VIAKKDDGFWLIEDDTIGDKTFFHYNLEQPNRQTIEIIVQRVNGGSRITKYKVTGWNFIISYFLKLASPYNANVPMRPFLGGLLYKI